MLSVIKAQQCMIKVCPRDLERLIFEEYDEGFIFRLAGNFTVMNFVFLLAVHNNKSIFLCTIHADIYGFIFPCVYILCVHKNRATYDNIFAHLNQAVLGLELTISAESIMMDFELTPMNSARDEFPDVIVRGCLFHLNQSLWKKLQELGLSSQYSNSEIVSIRNSFILL